MRNIERLISVCKSYINGSIELEAFQRQIEEIFLPDECKRTLEVVQHNAFNELEKIRFCYLPEQQRQHAKAVAEKLICAARHYLNSR